MNQPHNDNLMPNDRGEQFISLYTQIELDLRSYILANLASWTDAQDVLRQTSLILWRKFDDFQEGTSFFHWACQVARYEILKFRKELARTKDRVVFSDKILSQIQDKFTNENDHYEMERKALVECQEQLEESDRELIKKCYYGNSSIKEVAHQSERTPTSLYKRLNRIRKILFQCIDGKIKRWQQG